MGSLVIPKDSLRIDKGAEQLKDFTLPDSATNVVRSFCRTCGTHVTAHNGSHPFIAVNAGTVADPSRDLVPVEKGPSPVSRGLYPSLRSIPRNNPAVPYRLSFDLHFETPETAATMSSMRIEVNALPFELALNTDRLLYPRHKLITCFI